MIGPLEAGQAGGEVGDRIRFGLLVPGHVAVDRGRRSSRADQPALADRGFMTREPNEVSGAVTWGLLAAWAVHDTEEVVMVPRWGAHPCA